MLISIYTTEGFYMRQRIVAAAVQPEFWLAGLVFWILISAERSLGTPWACAALTEALRWSAGIGLAFTIGTWVRRTKTAAQGVVVLTGVLALLGIVGGLQRGYGGLTGPYREHQLYGSALLILLPWCAAVAWISRTLIWRLGAIAAMGVGFFCLLLSQTRSAWAGALAAALVFGGLWLSCAEVTSYQRRSWGAVAIALFTGLLLLLLLTTPKDLREPLTTRIGTLSTLQSDTSWQERLSLWRGASHLATSHPLIGIGLGRYPGAQWAWTGKGRLLGPSERPSLSEEAHDFYLQTAGEIGLVGLGLYGAMLAAFIYQALRRLRRGQVSRRQAGLVIAALSMLTGQAVDAVASPSWQFAEASLFFWALLGLGLAALRPEHLESSLAPVSTMPRRIGQWALSGAAAVALTAMVLPIGLLPPVEAYTPPSGSAFQSAVVTGSTQTAKAGDTVYFKMIATYTTAQYTYTPNVSNESTTFFFATVPPGMAALGTFTEDVPNQRVIYVVPASAKGQNLKISGSFKNGFITMQTSQNATLVVSP
jgi:O-antigen ligase